MSVLELKGELHEIIVSLQTEKALLKVLEFAKKAFEEEDLGDLLSKEQIERLNKSIENSKNRDNLITHEEARKRHAKWLTSKNTEG